MLYAVLRVAVVLALWPAVRAAYWVSDREPPTTLADGLRYAIRPEVGP